MFDVATRGRFRGPRRIWATFRRWGWKPGCFLMLPIVGPSNERDLLRPRAANTAANPLIYFSPYALDQGSPETCVGPYGYFASVVTYNDSADTVEDYVRFLGAEMDPYSEIQYAWTFAREPGWPSSGPRRTRTSPRGRPSNPSFSPLRTRNSPAAPGPGRPGFHRQGRKLRFTYWLHPGRSPVVYILPGLGAHGLARPCLAAPSWYPAGVYGRLREQRVQRGVHGARVHRRPARCLPGGGPPRRPRGPDGDRSPSPGGVPGSPG